MTTLRGADLSGTETLDPALVEQLRSRFSGALISPSDPTYDETRGLWNGMIDKRPSLIARCLGLADVLAAVDFARTNKLLLAIRGGGHNVAGTASCDGGLMVDLSLMRAVLVNQDDRTVMVQGGATLGDIDREAQVFGLAVPGGVVSTTGVAGLTLGGGTGWQMRKRGLTIDNLISAEIVTAAGEVLIASEDVNEDLFWAIRGGGGNFGVVTSFRFRAHPVGPEVYVCSPMYPAELSAEVLAAWRDFVSDVPRELACAFFYWSIPADEFFPVEVHGAPVAVPVAVYVGPPEEGERLTKPLRKLGTPLVDFSGPTLWRALQTMFDSFVPKQQLQYYWKSLYLNSLDDAVVQDLLGMGTTIPSTYTYTPLALLGGAVSDVAADATAFGRRDMPYLLELDSMWADPSEAARNIQWTRETWTAMLAHSDGSLYLNFPGLGEEQDRLVRSAVGESNYARLRQIKRLYDPENLFRVNLNIPPAE
jgi:FAD/FMN-containing dehydrogenase